MSLYGDKGAAFTLLFLFENRRAREREPLVLVVNKSPAVFIREIDDLQRENRSTISKEKVEGL